MRKFLHLSYTLNEATPVYPGDAPVSVTAVRQMKKGDTCNTSSISISSHAGTHMDAPRHFFKVGKGMGEYDLKKFIFKHPYVIDCPKKPGEAIRPEDIRMSGRAKKADIVIIRTGFGKYRSKNTAVYCHENPYLLPMAAERIVKNFPRARAVGIDTVSVSAKTNSSLGKETHRILLGKGIVIIEDMRLSGALGNLKEIIVFPAFTCSPDGSPCAVIGVIHD